MDIKQLKKIIRIFEGSSLSELEIEEKGARFKLVKPTAQVIDTENPVPLREKRDEVKGEEKEKKEKDKELFSVRSPLVGTFYKSPSPEDEPFVGVGDEVTEGQALCIIEAMKVMNEITSEVKGMVKEVLVENGQPVEYDQELFLIERE